MAEDNIIKAMDDSPHNKSDAEVIAVKKVFGTYELLESIILKLDPRDIPAMSMVNKACHDITSTNKAYKRLMSSSYFSSKAKANALTCLASFGRIAVLRVHDKEVIVVQQYDPKKVTPSDAKSPLDDSVLFTVANLFRVSRTTTALC
jgi:hypothetical protein